MVAAVVGFVGNTVKEVWDPLGETGWCLVRKPSPEGGGVVAGSRVSGLPGVVRPTPGKRGLSLFS